MRMKSNVMYPDRLMMTMMTMAMVMVMMVVEMVRAMRVVMLDKKYENSANNFRE